MINLKQIHVLRKSGFLFVVACELSGCSTIQSWFPDKEKDYQFTNELPPLVIPADLMQKPVVPSRTAPVEPITNSKTVTKTIAPATESVQPINRPALSKAETELSRDEIQVSVTHENAPTLNLNVPSVRAWRIVGKALSRSGIEVLNRNQDDGQIQIQVVDTKPKSEPEKSVLDETFSVFDSFVSNEKSYVLQFHETNAKTAVTVLDAELQPITDGSDDKLLIILFEAIKTDLSK